MEKGRWFGKDYNYTYDRGLINEVSHRFGLGIKFNSLDEVVNYQMNLTQQLQVIQVCGEKVIKNITRYPIEVHVAGF